MQVEKVPTVLYDHVAEAARLEERLTWAIRHLQDNRSLRPDQERAVENILSIQRKLHDEIRAARVAASKNRNNWLKVLNWIGLGHPSRDLVEGEAEFEKLAAGYNPDNLTGRDELSDEQSFVTRFLTGRLEDKAA